MCSSPSIHSCLQVHPSLWNTLTSAFGIYPGRTLKLLQSFCVFWRRHLLGQWMHTEEWGLESVKEIRTLHTPNPCSSFTMKGQVSQPHKQETHTVLYNCLDGNGSEELKQTGGWSRGPPRCGLFIMQGTKRFTGYISWAIVLLCQ